MRIYYSTKSSDSSELAKAALLEYMDKTDELAHDSEGHPFFADTDVSVSISHSGGLWVCSLSREKAGIDVEVVRDRAWQRISERHFTGSEKAVVADQGIAGFYRVWTRKEAYAKYTGEGLVNSLNREITGVHIEYIDICDGYVCALCTKDKVTIDSIEELK